MENIPPELHSHMETMATAADSEEKIAELEACLAQGIMEVEVRPEGRSSVLSRASMLATLHKISLEGQAGSCTITEH